MSGAFIAVCGASEADDEQCFLAEDVGAALAEAGAVVLSGGLGGVMEAACRGARSKRGHTIGLLPGLDRAAANGWVEFALPTGMGELRNGLLVRAADAVIAIGGSAGTLTEVAFALRTGVPVVGLGLAWELEGVGVAADPAHAVQQALAAAAL